MKRGLIFIFLWMFVFGFSQSKLTVINEAKGTPIPNAIISCNDKFLGKTDDNGFLEFKSKCKSIQIKAANYFKESAIVEDEMTVTLINTSSKTQSIETVILEDKSDPKALEILRKVNQFFKSNSPQSLDSYTYKSYDKISLDIDQDSISVYTEIFNNNFNLFKKQKAKDSVNDVSARRIFSKSKLFLWERAQEYLYSKKYGEKVNILDNRISGLKQPIYELIALQGNRDKIPEQIKPENRGLYRFYLTDTIEVEGRKNFVIRFREVSYKKNVKRRKFSGYLYIDIDTYGIKKIESISKDKNDGNITSTWIFFNNKWFLSEESVKLRMSRMMMNNTESTENSENHLKKHKNSFGTYAYLSSKYFDYESPIEENQKDFKGYTFTVKNADGKTLQKYRTEPLSDREKNTYFVIDSLGKNTM
ncbi:hypothetical protein [Chryseobacterium sp. 3008163]|uniref:hypothetical protein n=1 Tax=Chryseobacterium sp. 3008163 TaxID=2478663 RepID=UPI001E40DD08|nr:hypothetical protein [Chryseobacterium sp. 3008163]